MPPAETPRGNSRFDPMWLLMLAAALLLARIGVGVWESSHPPTGADLIHWVPAENAAMQSRSDGRPILYDFSAEWCGPCQAMKRDVFANRSRAQALQSLVVPVSVEDRVREDGRNPAAVDSLQHAYAIYAFPSLVIASPTTGRFEKREGYSDPDETLQWIARTATAIRMAPGTGK